jgi:hypothetical protein
MIQTLDSSRNSWRLLWLDLEDPVPLPQNSPEASRDGYYLPTCIIITTASGKPLCPPEILEELDQQKAELLLGRLFDEFGTPDRLTIAESEDWDPEDWKNFAQECRLEIAFGSFPAAKPAELKKLAKGIALRLSCDVFHTPETIAKGLVETARRLRSPTKKSAHFRKAVEQDEGCLAARIELADADYQAARWNECRKAYQEIVEREQRRWTGETPSWWSDVETRPFMRALYGRAMTEWQAGRFQNTAADLSRLLAMNPTDNQGVRFLIPMVHLLADDDVSALESLSSYEKNYLGDYCEPALLFGKGLAHWRSGDEDVAAEAYREGMLRNLHIAPLLLDLPLPPADIWHPNDRAELSYAQDFIQSYATLWDRDPAALRFLRETRERCQAEIDRLTSLRHTMHEWQDQRYDRNYKSKWKALVEQDDLLSGNGDR